MYNNPFSSAKPAGGGGDVSNQLMVTVKQDMESAEVSGQWIFSCYSPGKDCASVPGMEDVSPEELRSVSPVRVCSVFIIEIKILAGLRLTVPGQLTLWTSTLTRSELS